VESILRKGIRKRHILLVLLLVLALIILLLVYIFLSNPTMHETFKLAFSEGATKELNLTTGEHVSVWLSAMPPGMSGRSAQSWVIKFYVTDPHNYTILDTLGIARTGWLYPLSFVARQDGVYTLHFNNTVGGNIDKTVSLSYKITQSIYGIPIEHILLFVLAVIVVLILILAVPMLIERRRAISKISPYAFYEGTFSSSDVGLLWVGALGYLVGVLSWLLMIARQICLLFHIAESLPSNVIYPIFCLLLSISFVLSSCSCFAFKKEFGSLLALGSGILYLVAAVFLGFSISSPFSILWHYGYLFMVLAFLTWGVTLLDMRKSVSKYGLCSLAGFSFTLLAIISMWLWPVVLLFGGLLAWLFMLGWLYTLGAVTTVVLFIPLSKARVSRGKRDQSVEGNR